MYTSKYFGAAETECHCGCGFNNPHPLLMQKLDALRERAGVPLTLTNVCRCEEHNAEVGGVYGSQHTKGTAADVAVPDNMTVDSLCELALELGFDGVGCYYADDFVHVDVRSLGEEPGYYQWSDDD